MSFQLRKINVLIGDQSTGKSTVAKLIAAINSMAQGETLSPGRTGLMREDEYGKMNHFRRHLEIYDIGSYLNPRTKISYIHPLFTFRLANNDCGIVKKRTVDGGEV